MTLPGAVELDHVALVVKDIRLTLEALSALGLPCEEIRRHNEVGMDIAFAGSGPSRLELLQAVTAESPVADHPGGPHHIALAVQDIEAAYREMTASPLFSVDGPIRQGAHSRIFFFRIRAAEDTLYECTENAQEAGDE